MSCRRHAVLVTVWITSLPVGCALEGPIHEHDSPTSTTWPKQLAGRSLRFVTDDYALYATDSNEARILDIWVRSEIARFREQFDFPFQSPGLILAMEPGDEPSAPIEAWRRRHADRSNRFFYGWNRPYCFFRKPFFRESFSLPAEQLRKFGLLINGMPTPAWTCFLCTDQHVREEFAAKVEEHMKGANDESDAVLAKMPPLLRLHQRVALGMFRVMAAMIIPKYCSINIDLMRLQRRETLQMAVLDTAGLTDAHHKKERQRSRKQIDARWKYIWERRPIE